jgi:hypothetical protein
MVHDQGIHWSGLLWAIAVCHLQTRGDACVQIGIGGIVMLIPFEIVHHNHVLPVVERWEFADFRENPEREIELGVSDIWLGFFVRVPESHDLSAGIEFVYVSLFKDYFSFNHFQEPENFSLVDI